MIPKEDNHLTCGIWPFEGAFIHLAPADLDLGDLVERATGCPLRAKDWRQLAKLAHRGATDRNRLTKSRLVLLLQAFRGGASGITESQNNRDYNHSTVIPEMFEHDLNDLELLDFRRHAELEKLASYLPFLHCDEARPEALLSPGNAAKLLFNWDKLWTALCKHTGTQGRMDRSKLAGIGKPDTSQAPRTVAELDRGVKLASSALAYLHDPIDISTALTPLAHLQHAAQGIRSLLPATRQNLLHVMLRLYTAAPHIWCDLERWMGTETFAAAMPVRNIDAFRANARVRVAAMVTERWQEAYTYQSTPNL